MLQGLFTKLTVLLGHLSPMAATATESVAETITEATTEASFNFRPGEFISNLKYMAAGMVGIFLVIGAIILTIVVLGKLTSRKKKDGEGEE